MVEKWKFPKDISESLKPESSLVYPLIPNQRPAKGRTDGQALPARKAFLYAP